jgi:uncharacterized protein YjbI with pentapeptide repeats
VAFAAPSLQGGVVVKFIRRGLLLMMEVPTKVLLTLVNGSVQDFNAFRVATKHEALDLSGVNLSFLNLVGIDFGNVRLFASDLRGCNLNEADFAGSSLEGANLAEADLTEANLQHVRFGNTPFGPTILAGAKLDGTDLTGATGYAIR